MTTALFFHDSFLRHDTGPLHPENPERLRAILSGLKEAGLWEALKNVSPEPATEEEILLCHPRQHLEFIRECSRSGSFQIDPDTHVSSHSYEAALRAAGAAVQAVDGILDGDFKNAFAAVRPPGHHATPDRAMGFCLFNNIAIAARHAIKNRGLQRVLIMDWDVHHGNGTQDIFYDDPSVFYISLHKWPHYPGTGSEEERGERKGRGTNINIPLAGVPGPQIYEEHFQKALARAQDFRPEFIFISCGFDAHEKDPLGNLGLKNETYGRLTEFMINFAAKFGHERVFSILEGGYDYKALAASGAAHVERLMNYRPAHD